MFDNNNKLVIREFTTHDEAVTHNLSEQNCILLHLPKEIWKLEISSHLGYKDKVNLRLTCKKFWISYIVYPCWKQIIPYEELILNKYLSDFQKFNIIPHIYGVTLSANSDVMRHQLTYIPSSVKFIDFSKSKYARLSTFYALKKLFFSLPKGIERIELHFMTYFDEKLLLGLLQKYDGLKINFLDYDIFHGACLFHYNDLIKYLIKSGKVNVNSATSTISKALNALIDNGREEIIKFFLENCTDLNSHSLSTYAIIWLHNAISNGNINIINMLLEKSADILTTRSLEDFLHHAMSTRNSIIINLIQQRFDNLKKK